jgi:hypothetical protein
MSGCDGVTNGRAECGVEVEGAFRNLGTVSDHAQAQRENLGLFETQKHFKKYLGVVWMQSVSHQFTCVGVGWSGT